VIVVFTAGSVTPPIIFWFSEPRTGSEGSTLPVLLIPAVMRPAVMCDFVVVSDLWNYIMGKQEVMMQSWRNSTKHHSCMTALLCKLNFSFNAF
jgi:hypothetical protein